MGVMNTELNFIPDIRSHEYRVQLVSSHVLLGGSQLSA